MRESQASSSRRRSRSGSADRTVRRRARARPHSDRGAAREGLPQRRERVERRGTVHTADGKRRARRRPNCAEGGMCSLAAVVVGTSHRSVGLVTSEDATPLRASRCFAAPDSTSGCQDTQYKSPRFALTGVQRLSVPFGPISGPALYPGELPRRAAKAIPASSQDRDAQSGEDERIDAQQAAAGCGRSRGGRVPPSGLPSVEWPIGLAVAVAVGDRRRRGSGRRRRERLPRPRVDHRVVLPQILADGQTGADAPSARSRGPGSGSATARSGSRSASLKSSPLSPSG